jgi:hypothetical protein
MISPAALTNIRFRVNGAIFVFGMSEAEAGVIGVKPAGNEVFAQVFWVLSALVTNTGLLGKWLACVILELLAALDTDVIPPAARPAFPVFPRTCSRMISHGVPPYE